MRFATLEAGAHSFSVRARGASGLYDRTPAVRSFDVVTLSSEQGPAPPVGGEQSSPFLPPTTPADEEAAGASSLFAADSVWTTPLSSLVALDPSSPPLIAKLLRQIEAEQAAKIGPSLGTRSRTSLYRVGPDQPRIPVFLDTGPWGDVLAARFQAGVPVPAGARPIEGHDHSMAIWQPSSDSYWEFFQFQQALHAPQFARSPFISGSCVRLGGTYAYKLTSLNERGETRADAAQVQIRVPVTGGCVTIRWRAINGATGYRIYRGFNGSALSHLATVSGDNTSFVDDDLLQPDGTPPPAVNTADTPGEWHASFGGFIPEVSKNPGYYQDVRDSNGEVVEQSFWGASATGMPLAGGLITKQDIDRGRIDHALSLGLMNGSGNSILRAGAFAFPAQRSDGRSGAPDSIPEGARLVLDPSLDIDSLGLSPFVHMLAEAAQRYGMIVHEGSLATVIYAEDPAPFVAQGGENFYRPLIGRDLVRAMRGFPWGDLEVAQMRLCTSHPCAGA